MSPICVLLYFWFHVEWNYQQNLENIIIQKCHTHSNFMKCPISCYYFDKCLIELYSLIYSWSILCLVSQKSTLVSQTDILRIQIVIFQHKSKISLSTILSEIFIIPLYQIVSNKCLPGIIQKSWIIELPMCSFPTISCKGWNVRSFIIWSPTFSCI